MLQPDQTNTTTQDSQLSLKILGIPPVPFLKGINLNKTLLDFIQSKSQKIHISNIIASTAEIKSLVMVNFTAYNVLYFSVLSVCSYVWVVEYTVTAVSALSMDHYCGLGNSYCSVLCRCFCFILKGTNWLTWIQNCFK